MTSLRLAYLALSVGLMGFGGVLVWLGLRRPSRPASSPLRVLMTLAILLAVAGVAGAIVLEARAARPW